VSGYSNMKRQKDAAICCGGETGAAAGAARGAEETTGAGPNGCASGIGCAGVFQNKPIPQRPVAAELVANYPAKSVRPLEISMPTRNHRHTLHSSSIP